MEEIKAGEYIRTQTGKIGQVIRIWQSANCKKKRYLIDWSAGRATYISQMNNIKHSKNIIDLIEEKDIVCAKDNIYNEIYVSVVCKDYKDEVCIVVYECDEIRKLEECVKNNKIELISILTHEQFGRECYKIGD